MNKFFVCSVAVFAGITSLNALAAPPSLVTIYDFQGSTDGSASLAGLVADKAGNLYGVTPDGGVISTEFPVGAGTVFELSPPGAGQTQWTKTVIHSFAEVDIVDGATPSGGLVIDKMGVLYGNTKFGGSVSTQNPGLTCGDVFSLAPPTSGQAGWSYTILHAFPPSSSSSSDGCNPAAPLFMNKKGNLFGTTVKQANGNPVGQVFEVVRPATAGDSWTEKVLTFDTLGIANPQTGVVTDSAGNLFGVSHTYSLGQGQNTIYELSPPAKNNLPWALSNVFYFNGGGGIGTSTLGELHIDAGGILYGTTVDGGLGGAQAGFTGTAWSLAPPVQGQAVWTEIILHSFTLGNTGAYPMAGLIADKFGKLYGTTAGYSTDTYPARGAAVFSLVPPAPGDTVWDWKKLAAFDGTNGAFPMSGLIIAPNGKIYGTTTKGGAFGYGTIFELSR